MEGGEDGGNGDVDIPDYEIDEITGWRTFTKEEAKEFHDFFVYEDNADNLNGFLYENGYDTFYSDGRYLCQNGEYAFDIFGGPDIGKAGLKTKYYLRVSIRRNAPFTH